jgi:hypothetical protein
MLWGLPWREIGKAGDQVKIQADWFSGLAWEKKLIYEDAMFVHRWQRYDKVVGIM